MLNCEDVQPQISAYLDREMPLWKIQLIQLHLKRCSPCAHENMRLQQTHKILGQLDSVRTSNEFLSDVMRRVSTISSMERQRVLPIRRIFRRLESSLTWLQYRFWTRPSSYALGLSLALVVTVGEHRDILSTVQACKSVRLNALVSPVSGAGTVLFMSTKFSRSIGLQNPT